MLCSIQHVSDFALMLSTCQANSPLCLLIYPFARLICTCNGLLASLLVSAAFFQCYALESYYSLWLRHSMQMCPAPARISLVSLDNSAFSATLVYHASIFHPS